MGVSHKKNLFTVLFILSLLLASNQELVEAMRPLEGERWMKKGGGLVFQSLQKGPVPPLAGNPCTYIPGQGSGSCTLNGMNVAGSVVRAPPAFPDLVMEVGVASIGSNTHRQDQVS